MARYGAPLGAVLVCMLLAPASSGGDAKPAGVAEKPLLARGRWVLDAAGEPVPPRAFERGLQSSGLIFFHGCLWSVGDQRSEYPAHLFRIALDSARLIGAPIRIEVDPSDADKPLCRDFLSIRNPDFEGLARDPERDDSLVLVSEDKRQWLVEVRLSFSPPKDGAVETVRARLTSIVDLEFGSEIGPYRDDPNYRLEGVAADATDRIFYLAYERLRDERPRIFTLPFDEATGARPATPALAPIDFGAVGLRADKDRARLNVNGLELVRVEGRGERLLAIARDQERLLVIDPRSHRITAIVDILFRDPDGREILWVSPEGIAADAATDRVWIINDPDSIRGNYRLLGDEKASGRFADLVPLLFELRLSDVLGREH